VFVSRYEDGGERREEGEDVYCVCFSGFESGGVDGGEGESVFLILTQMKRFVLILCRVITFYPNTLVHAFYYN